MQVGNNHPIDGGEGVAGVGGVENNRPSLEAQFLALEAIFSKNIDTKKAETTAKLEAGQNQFKIIDDLINILNYENQPDAGINVSDNLKNFLNAQFNRHDLEQTPEKKALLDALKGINNAIKAQGIPDFQPLFQLVNGNAAYSSISQKLTAIGIVEGAPLDAEKIKKFQELVEFKEAKDKDRSIAQHAHRAFLETLKNSGLKFQASAYDAANFQALFAALALEPQHPLNEELNNKIGLVAGNQPTEAQMTQLLAAVNGAETDKTRLIREKLAEHHIIKLPEQFNARDAKDLINRLNTALKQQESFNNVESRQLTKLDDQLNRMYQALMHCIKKLDECIRKFAAGIKGG